MVARPVEGKQLRVFARGEWKQALVLQANEGVARVQFSGAGQSGKSAWVDVRSLGEGMIAGFERVSTPTVSRLAGSTPTSTAAKRLDRVGQMAESLRVSQLARSRVDSWSSQRALDYQMRNQSPARAGTRQYGSPHRTGSPHGLCRLPRRWLVAAAFLEVHLRDRLATSVR